MKKIIALALALIMALSMGSVAFAAHNAGDYACEVATDTHLVPGETYKLSSATGIFTLPTEYTTFGSFLVKAGKYTAKDWKVSTDWTKGGALVEGVAYNKDDKVWELTLKENYTITTEKDLVGEITFVPKGDAKKEINDKDFEVVVKVNAVVANHIVEIYGADDKDDALEIKAEDNTLYKCEEDEAGYVKFNTNALLSATLNMASEEKAFMYNDEKAIEALEEKFPEAEIECYNFGGAPTFKNAAEFTLQADYADQYYIYAYANGKLEAQDAEWDSIEGVYTWTTKSPVSYVISDVELVAAADDAATTNPDTGANDVVGVAAALAVVSLVAAGAVSLKK